MADFMSVQPVGGMGNALRATPPAPQPMVAEPAGSSASGSSDDLARDPGKSAAEARFAAGRRAFDEKVLTGPPPSFEASLLEVEGNLEATIRRIEQARERARAGDEAAVAGIAANKADPIASSDKAAKGDPAIETEAPAGAASANASVASDPSDSAARPEDPAAQ